VSPPKSICCNLSTNVLSDGFLGGISYKFIVLTDGLLIMGRGARFALLCPSAM
jgi:hypothetical protein